MPDNELSAKPCWTVIARENEAEAYVHYSPKAALRRLASLGRKYQNPICLTPDGTRHTKTSLRELLGLAPLDPSARTRAGRLGGIATASKLNPAQRSQLAALAARARWQGV